MVGRARSLARYKYILTSRRPDNVLAFPTNPAQDLVYRLSREHRISLSQHDFESSNTPSHGSPIVPPFLPRSKCGPLLHANAVHFSRELNVYLDDYFHRMLIICKFPDQTEAEAAIKALAGGLRLTLRRFPFLAGTLSLTDHESGKLGLDYPTQITDEDLAKLLQSKQIPFDEKNFPYTYEQLRRDGMPSSAFHAAMFVPDDFVDFPGIPEFGEGQVDFNISDAPAMRLQACFIPGGLVLSMYIHHSVLDFSGNATFWTVFSANVSKVSGLRQIDPDELFGMCQSLSCLHVTDSISSRERCRATIIDARETRSAYPLFFQQDRKAISRLLL